MAMNCFMFPGQPLAYFATFPAEADFVDIAAIVRRRTGMDIESFGRPGAEYSNQVMLQLLGVAMSLYRLRLMRKILGQPEVVAEHSMGIYAALAACGCLPEAEVIELTWRVGQCLAKMGREERYAFGCVTGLSLGQVAGIAANHDVYLANHNTSLQFLLSGRRTAIESAIADARAQSALSARVFPSDAPLHTPMIAELESDLRLIFSDYQYREPDCFLIDHLEQRFLAAADLPRFMLTELSQPVYWERTYLTLRMMGVVNFYEIGMGDALKKYNRWIASNENLDCIYQLQASNA